MRCTLVKGARARAPGWWVLTLAVSCAFVMLPVEGLVAQQTGTVTGMISNGSTGAPVSGAQISVPGSGLGQLSQPSGRYLILNVPAGEQLVRVEILGFGTQEQTVSVPAAGTVTLDFVLQMEAVTLDEVVVTGTAGAARRREIGNSVSSVNVSELSTIKPPTNVSDLLQGQVTGLQQFTTEGAPGAGTQITIRGNNSITQGNTPLIYVDGVRLAQVGAAQQEDLDTGAQQITSQLNMLNPDDIERIEVIKGAAATTLYGTEANGGVIQIFTKRGREGPAQWSIQATGSMTRMTGNNLGPVVGDHPTWVNIKPWVNDAFSRKLNASVRGSARGISYYLSGENSFEQGIFSDQPNGMDSQVTSFRTNLGFQPIDGLNIAANMSYSHRYTNWVQSGDNRYGVILNLLRSPRNYVSGDDILVFDQKTTSIDDHFTGGVTFSYNPIASFTNRLTLGVDWRDDTSDWVIPKDHPIREEGYRMANRWRHTTWTFDYVGTFQKDFMDDFTSQSSFGLQAFNDYDQLIQAYVESFSGPGLDQDLDSGATPDADESFIKQLNAGFFLQEMIGWKDQLFVTAGLRVDGHSAFGDDYGFQPYPKLSASYVVSDLDATPDWVDVLKIRGAVGESGKAPGVFDAVRSYSPASGNDGQPGITPDNIGDPDLGPERTREYETGFEGSLWENRVEFDFSYYNATTRDALVPVQSPPSQGFEEPQLSNVGEINNKGIELKLGLTPYRSTDLTVELTSAISTNNSEARDLAGEQLQIGFQSWRQWAREGSPVPAYYAVKVMNPDEIAEPVYGSDQYYGPVYPTHNYSFGLNVNFLERFNLYALGEGAGGHYHFAAVARQQATRVVDGVSLWPQCNVSDPGAQNALWRARCDDREWSAFIMPADYFKLRTISLTYQIPETWIPRAGQSSFTLSANNIYKWTDYIGLDPELTRGDRNLERREYYHVPPGTTLTASLRILF